MPGSQVWLANQSPRPLTQADIELRRLSEERGREPASVPALSASLSAPRSRTSVSCSASVARRLSLATARLHLTVNKQHLAVDVPLPIQHYDFLLIRRRAVNHMFATRRMKHLSCYRTRVHGTE
jgi:hypothetical protein